MPIPFEQRSSDHQEALRVFFDGRQADIWTAMPGMIVSFNAEAITAVVQPAIQELYTGANLAQKFITLPLCLDVPVVFPRGGDYTLTFPVKAGDECLLVFMSRCMDSWWAQGGVQPQSEKRMHDLSDGMVFVGPFSQKQKISNVSTTTTQLRTNDGKMFVELDLPNKVTRMVNNDLSVVLDENATSATVTAPKLVINASVSVDLNTPIVRTTGQIQAQGNLVAGVGTASTLEILSHRHSLSGGTGNGGPPVPGT